MFSVNLDIAKPATIVTEQLMKVAISAVFSTSLQLFSINKDNRTRQIRGIVSAVTGVAVDHIQLHANTGQPPAGTPTGKTSFQIVLSIQQHKSPYQEQRVRRLGTHFSQPGSGVRVRVDSMLQEMIETWTPYYVPGNDLSIVSASVYFETAGSSTAQPPSMPFRRRLLEVTDSTAAPLRRAASAAWNQTSTFFVRSHDTTDNSDSMLAFLSTPGNFSRMCVLSMRYSIASYCRLDEAQVLVEMNAKLAEPLRVASGGQIVRATAVAIAPGEATSCVSGTHLDSPPTARRTGNNNNAAHGDMLLLVEIILHSHTSGSLTLGSTPELQNAGVVKINIIATKKTQDNGLAVSLNASGFLSDGSLLLPSSVRVDVSLLQPTASSSSTATVVAVVVGVLAAVSCAFFAYLRRQKHHLLCVAAHGELPVQYTSVALVPHGCLSMAEAGSHLSSADMVHETVHPFYATVGDQFPAHAYATWRGREA